MNICLTLVNTVSILNTKIIIEAREIIETKVRPMNEIWQNMREECMDNSNGERQKALTRFEQLRKKGTVVDDKAELDSYREEKFGRSYFDEKGNIK